MPLIFPRDPDEILLTHSQCNHDDAQSGTNKYIFIGNKILW